MAEFMRQHWGSPEAGSKLEQWHRMWSSNTGAAILWAPSNPRWPGGLILLASPSWNRRPSLQPGQYRKLKQNIAQSQESHRLHPHGNIKQEKKYLMYKDSKCKKTCFSNYLAVGRGIEESFLKNLGHMEVGYPVFKDGKTQARISEN